MWNHDVNASSPKWCKEALKTRMLWRMQFKSFFLLGFFWTLRECAMNIIALSNVYHTHDSRSILLNESLPRQCACYHNLWLETRQESHVTCLELNVIPTADILQQKVNLPVQGTTVDSLEPRQAAHMWQNPKWESDLTWNVWCTNTVLDCWTPKTLDMQLYLQQFLRRSRHC